MSVSDRSEGTLITLPGVEQLTRYDLLLAVLPLPLFAGAGVSAVATVPVSAGIAVGSILAAILVTYALFVDAPT